MVQPNSRKRRKNTVLCWLFDLTIELSPNEYTVAKFLFGMSSQPESGYNTIPALHYNMANFTPDYKYWMPKDRSEPTGKWDYFYLCDTLERLVIKKLVSTDVSLEGRSYEWKYYKVKWFMTETQKRRFARAIVKYPKPKGKRGRPRKYKDNAERQRAYRERMRLLRKSNK